MGKIITYEARKWFNDVISDVMNNSDQKQTHTHIYAHDSEDKNKCVNNILHKIQNTEEVTNYAS